MKKLIFRHIVSFFCFAFLAFWFLSVPASAQRRDYMSEAEIEIIRDAQQIDLRVEALTKMIDRRLAVLNNVPEKIGKNSEKWGAPPTGTRTELLSDINKLLQKAVDDIDDLAEHNRMDSELFPKAMRHLAAAAAGYLPQIKSFYDRKPDEKERGLLIGAQELCDSIIEAAAKVPKEDPNEKKKKKSKKDQDTK